MPWCHDCDEFHSRSYPQCQLVRDELEDNEPEANDDDDE